MKRSGLLCMILALAMILSISVFAVGVSAEGIAKAENVRFVADGGSDTADGKTAAAPYATFQKAVGELASTGGVIVIVGKTSIDTSNCINPANDKPITVTSYYDGVDYRTKAFGSDKVGARFVLMNSATAAWDFFGEFSFDYVVFSIPDSLAKNCIIAFNYHSFSIGDNCSTVYEDTNGTVWYDGSFASDNNARYYPPILLLGENLQAGGRTITGEYTIYVGSGDWQSLRVGDRDNVGDRNVFDGKATMTVTGGHFVSYTGNPATFNMNLMGTYQICTTENAVINMIVTGGKFDGQISGFGNVTSKSTGDYYAKGTVNMYIYGGTWDRIFNGDGNYIYAVQDAAKGYDGTAKANVYIDTAKLNFGILDSTQIISYEGVTSALTLSAKADNITNTGFGTVNVAAVPALGATTPTTPDEPAVTTAAPAAVTTAAGTSGTPVTGDIIPAVLVLALAAAVVSAVIIRRRIKN